MQKKKTFMTLMVAMLAIILIIPLGARAETIKIQAMRLGSSWYVFGATLSTLLKDNLPAGTNMEVVPKGGGVGNPISVSKDPSKIGLANVATVVWAWNGHPVVYKGKQYRNIRALVGGLNSVWITAMAREAYIKQTGNDTLEKILLTGTPVRVVMKPAGSSVPVVADMVLKAMGTGRDKIVADGGKIIQVSAKQIPALVRDNRVDLYFESALKGHPVVTETSLTGNVRFLDMPDGVLQELAEEGLNPVPLPQWFKGQSGPTKALDMGTLLIANEKLSDERAYQITKTLCENKKAMASAHKAWSNFIPEDAWRTEKTGIPLHPGAVRYYKEKGWMK
jgi:TRAP transporter TAXI family solute receptor